MPTEPNPMNEHSQEHRPDRGSRFREDPPSAHSSRLAVRGRHRETMEGLVNHDR